MTGPAPLQHEGRHALGEDSFVDLFPDFLGHAEAEALRAELTLELEWEQREIYLFGRAVLQPRLVAWGGALPYRYSGQTLEPRSLPACIEGLLARVAARAGAPFNHVLMNRYRSGEDSMGIHSDDEPELGPEPTVATLSLGATRPLVVVPRNRNGVKLRLELPGGSLLVMGGACQRTHRHGIPKTTRPVGERISLTFRNVCHAPRG